MQCYLDLLKHVMDHGIDGSDRTGTGTRSVFGYQLRLNLQDGFPLSTTKKLYVKGIVHELLWFLKGETNIQYLTDNNVHIWDAWADKDGNVGPIYGKQWVNWEGKASTVNQIEWVINEIKTNPSSRRLIVSAWNVADLPKMGLPPCPFAFQFYVRQGNLSCQLYQRSSDCFLGVPFDIASYSLLTHLIAAECGLGVGDFIWTSGDTHIYHNHFDQVYEQLKRQPKALPRLQLTEVKASVFDYTDQDILIVDYDADPSIKAPIAV